jgi:hypothetical protein
MNMALRWLGAAVHGIASNTQRNTAEVGEKRSKIVAESNYCSGQQAQDSSTREAAES